MPREEHRDLMLHYPKQTVSLPRKSNLCNNFLSLHICFLVGHRYGGLNLNLGQG